MAVNYFSRLSSTLTFELVSSLQVATMTEFSRCKLKESQLPTCTDFLEVIFNDIADEVIEIREQSFIPIITKQSHC